MTTMTPKNSQNSLAWEHAGIVAPMTVHIGYPRTGSSFVQQNILNVHPDCAMFQYEKDATEFARNPDGREIVLTNESYTGWTDGDRFEEAAILHRKFPNARIVMFIRSQHKMFRSYYYLYVKGGGTQSFAEFVTARCGSLFAYARMYDTYVDLFGADKVFVFFHEELLRDMRGTAKQLLRVANLDPAFADSIENAQVKPSMPESAIYLMRLHNRLKSHFGGKPPSSEYEAEKPFNLPGVGLAARHLAGLLPPIDDGTVAPLIDSYYGAENDRILAAIGKPPGFSGLPSAALREAA